MQKDEPDLWFSFIRANRLLIREVERRVAESALPVYAWYDVLWGSRAARTARGACIDPGNHRAGSRRDPAVDRSDSARVRDLRR